MRHALVLMLKTFVVAAKTLIIVTPDSRGAIGDFIKFIVKNPRAILKTFDPSLNLLFMNLMFNILCENNFIFDHSRPPLIKTESQKNRFQRLGMATCQKLRRPSLIVF